MPRTILLADDSLSVHRAVEKSLASTDDEILVATNGDEALALFQERRPDLALVDIHMPGASGYEVTRQIKSAAAELPVLLLVGTFEPYDERLADDSGADGHLMKPFDEAALRARIDELAGVDEAVVTEDEEPAATEPVRAESDEESGSEERVETARAERDPAGSRPADDEVTREEAPVGGPEILSESDVERIARRVVELVSSDVVERVAREVLPEIAEAVVRRRIDELEGAAD
ncbi:MAG: response regulator [Thermoanaerobaculia bacterium]|nr:response regulator [Thermoanaerobaculia bacterium]